MATLAILCGVMPYSRNPIAATTIQHDHHTNILHIKLDLKSCIQDTKGYLDHDPNFYPCSSKCVAPGTTSFNIGDSIFSFLIWFAVKCFFLSYVWMKGPCIINSTLHNKKRLLTQICRWWCALGKVVLSSEEESGRVISKIPPAIHCWYNIYTDLCACLQVIRPSQILFTCKFTSYNRKKILTSLVILQVSTNFVLQ